MTRPVPSARTADHRSLLLLVLLALLFCAPALISDRAYYYGDISRAQFAYHAVVARQARAGEWPLWTDQLFGGYPILAEGQVGFYYPPNWLYYLPGLPLTTGLKLSVLLHFFLAAAFAYLLARRVGLEPWPSRLAAVCFGFSGTMATRVIHQNAHHAAVWLPLVLACAAAAQQAPDSRRRLRALLLGGLALGIQCLTFYPPATFYTLLALLAFCLFPVVPGSAGSQPACPERPGRQRSQAASPEPPRRQRSQVYRRRLLDFAIAAGVGMAIGAAQILPTAELAAHSTREAGGYEYLTQFSLPLKHLATFVLPNLFGSPATDDYWGAPNHWELCGFVGVLPLLLGLAALAARREGRAALWFAGLALAALLMALGPLNPLYHLLPYVPGFNLFKAPARYLLLSTLGLAMLAGFGLQSVVRGQGTGDRGQGTGVKGEGAALDGQASQRAEATGPAGTPPARCAGTVFSRSALALGLLAAMGAALALVLRPWVTQLAETRMLPGLVGSEGRTRPDAYYAEQFRLKWDGYFTDRLEDLLLLAGLGLGSALLLWWARRRPAVAHWLAPVLVGVAALELLRFGMGYNPLIDRSFYTSRPHLAQAMMEDSVGRWAMGDRRWALGPGPSDSGTPHAAPRGSHTGPDPERGFRAWRVGVDTWEREVRAGHSGWGGSQEFEFQLREALPWNLNLYDSGGWRLLDGGTALPPDRVMEFCAWAEEALKKPGSPASRQAIEALEMLNVGYLVSSLDLRPAECRPVTARAGLTLYALPSPWPRAFVGRAVVVGSGPDPLADFLTQARQAAPEVVIERAADGDGNRALPSPELSEAALDTVESARVVDSDPGRQGRIVVEAVAHAPRLLVLQERFYPRWECRVDGRRVPIFRAAYLGMGVILQPGEHRVVFEYRPLSARVGLGISLVALVGVLGLFCGARRGGKGEV